MLHIFAKYIKLISKLIIIFIFMFTVSSLVNRNTTKRNITPFQIWKIGNNIPNDEEIKKMKMKNMKYILIWSDEHKQFDLLKDKQKSFKANNCKFKNCYVTRSKAFLDDYGKFHAILFSGKDLSIDPNFTLPDSRSPHQMYIFGTHESAGNYPICNEKFDYFFNLTWTYRLDSDIIWPYFVVINRRNETVAPMIRVNWGWSYKKHQNIDVKLPKKIYAASWFASHCYTNSKRESVVENLKAELKKRDLFVQKIGNCGDRDCPVVFEGKCKNIIKESYFYLAFENSMAVDYVTEKVYNAITQFSVPIVYGGATYNRFLPPHSYIDAGRLGVHRTTDHIAYLIKNNTAYVEYFSWHKEFHFEQNTESLCGLCEAMNRKDFQEPKVYKLFRKWWNPMKTDYKSCSKAK